MSDLKSDLKNELNEKTPETRQSSQSLFGPVLLIAVGIYFLLQNMGMLPDLNWSAVWRLWPVLLIFAGINLIVRQFSRPFGSLLSLLVAIAAVAFFGAALLFSDTPFFEQMGLNQAPQMKREAVEYAAGEVSSAEVRIGFSAQGADLNALSEGNNLIAGEVSYTDELVFDADRAGTNATITLATDDHMNWFLNPSNWGSMGEENRWQLGLNSDVALHLDLEMGSGPTNLDLSGLNLTHLELDGGSGPITLLLPDRTYELSLNVGSGPLDMTVPASGNHTFSLNGGSGPVTIYLPETMAAQIELETASGPFNPDNRFERVSSDDNQEIWQTSSYKTDGSGNQIQLIIEQGSGPITITSPQGR